MAENQDKTFDPTPQRIKKAREEGNLFKAQDLISILSLTVGMSVLVLGGPAGFDRLKLLARDVFLRAGTTEPLGIPSFLSLITHLGVGVIQIVLPFMLALTVVGVAANILQSGWNLTAKPLIPKPERISPLKGLKRIFSAQGLFTTLKSLLKIAIVGPIAYVNISGRLPELLMLHTLPLGNIFGLASHWLLILTAQIIVVLFLLSGVDFGFEKWRYKEDLKMSKQELKDEAKETEGDPKVKGKRRALAMKVSRRARLDHAVMKGDVVVTNPTHYAVVLRYDPEEAAAPRVLAKGVRKRALQIKALALEFGVPMVEDRPLARALYNTVEEAAEIPADLYPAVAALLAEIYRQQGRRPV